MRAPREFLETPMVIEGLTIGCPHTKNLPLQTPGVVGPIGKAFWSGSDSRQKSDKAVNRWSSGRTGRTFRPQAETHVSDDVRPF